MKYAFAIYNLNTLKKCASLIDTAILMCPKYAYIYEDNFDIDEAIKYCLDNSIEVVIAINRIFMEHELESIKEFVLKYKNYKFLISDLGVVEIFKELSMKDKVIYDPDTLICNSSDLGVYNSYGFDALGMSNEILIDDVKTSFNKVNAPIFYQVFGRKLMFYSKRKLLSLYEEYKGINFTKENLSLVEEKRPGQFFEMQENERGTFIMNSKDLCLLDRLDDILPVGMDSFKIEGRNKSEYYVAITARAYRAAIDSWFENPEQWNAEEFKKELYTLHCRGYTTGFLDGNAGPEAHNYTVSASTGDWRYAGQVLKQEQNHLTVLLKHKITLGTKLELLIPGQWKPYTFVVKEMYHPVSKAPLTEMSPGPVDQKVELVLEDKSLQVPTFSVLRTKIA